MKVNRANHGWRLAWAGVAVVLVLALAYCGKEFVAARTQAARAARAATQIAQLGKQRSAPTRENLEQLKTEVAQARAVLAARVAHLAQTNNAVHERREEREFKLFLARTLGALHEQARAHGAMVPPHYGFSFEREARVLGYPSTSLPALWAQVEDVQAVCLALFSVGRIRIEGIRRVAPAPFGPPNPRDILGGTNEVRSVVIPGTLLTPPREEPLTMEIWPYEITLDCPDEALDAVLNALADGHPARQITGLVLERCCVPKPKLALAPERRPGPRPPPLHHPPPDAPRLDEARWHVRAEIEVLRVIH